MTGLLVVGLTARSIGFRNHMIISGLFWVVPTLLLAFNLGAGPLPTIALYGLFGIGNAYMAATVSLLLLAAPGDQRGIVMGVYGTATNVGAALVQLIVFAVLAANVAHVVGGVPVYTATGFRESYLAVAGISLIGLLCSILIVQGRGTRRAGDAGVSDRLRPDHDVAAQD